MRESLVALVNRRATREAIIDHHANIRREEWATIFGQLEPGYTQIDHSAWMITVGKHPSLGSIMACDNCLEQLITIISSDFPARVLFEADEDDMRDAA